MPKRPNILLLIADQMRGDVLDADSPAHTPTFDHLVARGVSVTRAYTTSPTCSPARASLMTGRLPHNHGVLQVAHCQPPELVSLNPSCPHWAQHLEAAGYRTGYFGKWHVEPNEAPDRYGWQVDASGKSDRLRRYAEQTTRSLPAPTMLRRGEIKGPPGYPPHLFWGVTDRPAIHRGGGIVASCALEWLEQVSDSGDPWCCCISLHEPHDPFVVGREAFHRYDPGQLHVPRNWSDASVDRPGSYRKAARVFDELTMADRREIAACYYGMVTEVDQHFGRVIERLEQFGSLDDTLIVLTSDHGELLGAHGLYCKNIGAYEEVYRIPMVLAGAGIPAHGRIEARVGLHDLGATLTELAGVAPFATPESRSFAPLLHDPVREVERFTTGYAEYFGSRLWCTQRVLWDGPWKFVWNGAEEDELYHLGDDPGEMHNRVGDPACAERVRLMMGEVWRLIHQTGDRALAGAMYPPLRVAPCGPEARPGEAAANTGSRAD